MTVKDFSITNSNNTLCARVKHYEFNLFWQMAEANEIGGYYLERYRKHIRFSNIALSVALLILIVNWLFSIEPQFQSILETRKKFNSQLKVAQKKLKEYSNSYVRYYNRAYNPPRGFQGIERDSKFDSMLLFQYKSVADAVETKLDSVYKQLENFEESANDSLINQSSKFADSLRKFQKALEYAKNSSLFKDSVERIKKNIKDVNNQKVKSLNENLQDYDWKSLIRFLFLVAANPRDGTLYLMALIDLMTIFAFISRWLCLRYVSKAIRIYKAENPEINRYSDVSISAPFWLAPLPTNSKKHLSKVTGHTPENVQSDELARFMGLLHTKNQSTLIVLSTLFCLFILQLRLFHICFYTSPPIRFEFVFTIGIILLMISLVQNFLWFIPFRIDDHLNNEPPVNNIARRIFVATLLSATAAVVFFTVKDAILISYNINTKRFARNMRKRPLKKSKQLSPGFYLHESFERNTPERVQGTGRQILYFINSMNYAPVLKDIQNNEALKRFKKKLTRFEVEDLSALQSYDFNYGSSSWTIEHSTLWLIKNGKVNEALDFIFRNLDLYASPFSRDFQLMDLAVKLFIRFNKVTFLEQLIAQVQPAISAHEADNDSGMVPIAEKNEDLIRRLENWKNRRWVEKIKMRKYLVWNSVHI